jgi:hypothetical protein
MISRDFDGDGNLDLLLVGNDYGMDPYSGRHDAFMGLYMKGGGNGNFLPQSSATSGFYVKGDAKGLAWVHTASKGDIVIVTQNQDSLLAFGQTGNSGNSAAAQTNPGPAPGRWIDLLPGDFCADITRRDHQKRHLEFYYGSTYLSQSSRKLFLDKTTEKAVITDFRGSKRTLTAPAP